MKHTDLNRRDFSRLTMAAFGGALAGTAIGCGKSEPPAPAPAPELGESAPVDDMTAAVDENPLMAEPHVCRGLNACKNLGASKENSCAGQGACATAEKHECAKKNACKGQGGCGDTPGQNACKTMGACAVPLSEDAWKTARAAFEAAMTKSGKEVGAAPAGS